MIYNKNEFLLLENVCGKIIDTPKQYFKQIVMHSRFGQKLDPWAHYDEEEEGEGGLFFFCRATVQVIVAVVRFWNQLIAHLIIFNEGCQSLWKALSKRKMNTFSYCICFDSIHSVINSSSVGWCRSLLNAFIYLNNFNLGKLYE